MRTVIRLSSFHFYIFVWILFYDCWVTFLEILAFIQWSSRHGLHLHCCPTWKCWSHRARSILSHCTVWRIHWEALFIFSVLNVEHFTLGITFVVWVLRFWYIVKCELVTVSLRIFINKTNFWFLIEVMLNYWDFPVSCLFNDSRRSGKACLIFNNLFQFLIILGFLNASIFILCWAINLIFWYLWTFITAVDIIARIIV